MVLTEFKIHKALALLGFMCLVTCNEGQKNIRILGKKEFQYMIQMLEANAEYEQARFEDHYKNRIVSYWRKEYPPEKLYSGILDGSHQYRLAFIKLKREYEKKIRNGQIRHANDYNPLIAFSTDAYYKLMEKITHALYLNSRDFNLKEEEAVRFIQGLEENTGKFMLKNPAFHQLQVGYGKDDLQLLLIESAFLKDMYMLEQFCRALAGGITISCGFVLYAGFDNTKADVESSTIKLQTEVVIARFTSSIIDNSTITFLVNGDTVEKSTTSFREYEIRVPRSKAHNYDIKAYFMNPFTEKMDSCSTRYQFTF